MASHLGRHEVDKDVNLAKLVHLLDNAGFSNRFQANLASSSPDPFLLPKLLMETFKPMKLVPRPFVMHLLDLAIAQHNALPNVIHVGRAVHEDGTKGSLTVCGDTHGQFHDFCKIFGPEVAGLPADANRFVFNGDMTDRGPMGLEILLVLLATKQCSAKAMHILRGNHETLSMNTDFGFLREVLAKYDEEVFEKCQMLFATLPLGAVLEDSVFITHGGLGPRMAAATIQDINAVNRKLVDTLEHDDIFTEMLWADPKDGFQGLRRSVRGIACYYGSNVTDAFLQRNGLAMVIRSHECEEKGYRQLHGGRSLTVFSAPNYCGEVGNLGAVVVFRPDAQLTAENVTFRIAQFTEERDSQYTLKAATRWLDAMHRQKPPVQ